MKRLRGITDAVTVEDFRKAIRRAAEGHSHKREIIDILNHEKEVAEDLYSAYRDGSYVSRLKYRQLEKTNNNGKHRHIDSPETVTRIYQHFFLEKVEPVYFSKDNGNALNCKKGCGITAKDPRKSVLHRMKAVYFGRPELQAALVMDQRKCYDHISVPVFRRALRLLVDDRAFVDFAVDVVFVNGRLPIGTPTSPMAHHIVMLAFDIWAREISEDCVRYADDNVLFFRTKEEAQRARWRVANWWWYELGIRVKRQTVRVVPLSEPLDFCGYVFHRGGGGHSRGYVGVRPSTLRRARRATGRNWGSYFGILQHADCFGEMKRIEQEMNLSALTNRVKIQRKLDAPHMDIKDVCGKVVTIMDYELRRDKDNRPDWVKLLLSVPAEDGTGFLAREVHGGFQYLAQFLEAAEATFGGREAIIPIEGAVIENQCGYIFKDSTNQIKTFDK